MKKFIVLMALSTVGLCAQRSWVVEVDTTEHLYAVGDSHADKSRFLGVLQAAKLVDGAGKWTAKKSVLVITGDTIDKGPEQIKTISYIQTLQQDAASAGGRVILTLGNHEAEFLSDPKGKKTAEFSDALKAAGIKPKDVADCKGDLGTFMCGLPIAARVNDWFFSHGGYTAGRTIAQINSDTATGFAAKKYAADVFVGPDSILEARLSDRGPGGVPWFLGGNPNADPAKVLADYAAKLGVKHILQGHQPGKVTFPDGVARNKEDLFERYGLLFLNDGGMSTGIDGSTSTGGAMHITADSVTAVCANGRESLVIWPTGTNLGHAGIHCGK